MAVQPDRGARVALDPGALEALGDAGRAALAGARPVKFFEAVAEAVARATRAYVVAVRVLEPGSSELVARAVVSGSASLAAELEGTRAPLADLPAEETDLDGAPEHVRRLAARIGARVALVVPVRVAGETVGSVELLRERDELSRDELAASRLAASQVGLALRALGAGDTADRSTLDERAVRLAGDGLAAGSDVARTTSHVLRLALDVSGATTALLWQRRPDGSLRPASAAGAGAPELSGDDALASAGAAFSGAATHLGELAGRPAVALRLGEPPLGVLQLVFPAGRAPSADAVERLATFSVRAAQALRASERAQRVAAELDQTRALLGLLGQASAQLSVAHTLETATARLAELLEVERVAVYLRDEGRLVVASERGLAGPHLPVAESLFELALGPFRGRGMVEIADVRAEARFAGVADALAETGIECSIGLPLLVHEEVIGLLAAYPSARRELDANEQALLKALAGQLAVAVQNARLHEQATRLGAELEQAYSAELDASRRLRALYEVSRSFAESMSLVDTIAAITRAVVEQLEVDAAVIHLPDPRREQLVPQALHVADQQLEPLLRPILFRRQPLGGSALEEVFHTREPRVLSPDDAPLLAPFLEKGSTAAVVPLATSTAVVASLTLASLQPGRPLSAETIESARTLGAQAALAIENARLYQQQKDFADAMQRSLLPQVRPQVEGLEVGAIYAVSARIELGGDLYDYVELEDGRLAVVLGDVTGHGVDAAADMAMAKFVFRSLAREHPMPGDFLAAANEVVVGEIAPGKFITMLYLLIDPRTGEVICCSAGHPPPRLVAPDGSVEPLAASGLALGVETGQSYREVRGQLEPRGSVVLYTDGVVEARRGSELYGFERLDELLQRRCALPPQDLAASMIESARRFTGGELLDDCAVVVVRRT
jgi:serine phosphatase RsbU (regulator of sigma subunit)